MENRGLRESNNFSLALFYLFTQKKVRILFRNVVTFKLLHQIKYLVQVCAAAAAVECGCHDHGNLVYLFLIFPSQTADDAGFDVALLAARDHLVLPLHAASD